MNKISKREKIMLVILAVIVVAVCWYKFAYEPINNSIDEIKRSRENEQSEILVMQPKIQKMHEMEKELENLRADATAIKIPKYDNSKELMVALNKVMSAANSYQIKFGEADRDNYIFIHRININFNTDSYKMARKIIDRLTTETFVNQISNVVIDRDVEETVHITADGKEVVGTNENIDVALVITFFEVD